MWKQSDSLVGHGDLKASMLSPVLDAFKAQWLQALSLHGGTLRRETQRNTLLNTLEYTLHRVIHTIHTAVRNYKNLMARLHVEDNIETRQAHGVFFPQAVLLNVHYNCA